MKLMNAYSVAVYSTRKCILFNGTDVDQITSSLFQEEVTAPNVAQLESIQKDISFYNIRSNSALHSKVCNGFLNDKARVIVVVPDNWISVSQHRVDHIIPRALEPLAALSYALETTFTEPETLMFNYRQRVLEGKQSQLTVFACTCEWRAQLCSPFQAFGASCILMSQTQWIDVSVRNRSWSFLRKHALSIYQPEKEINKRALRLWGLLVLCSVLVHSGAYFYFWALQQQTEKVLTDRQGIVTLKSEWESSATSTAFVASALAFIQTLPTSVRLVQFDAGFDQAVLQVTLPRQELAPLLGRWRQDYSSWQFTWKREFDDQPSGLSGEEVMDDISIEISKK